ncbi:MAG: HEAT repeat domain-containing protein, partial [Verrucomicrobiales bacterium]|nr:HEAT repeat domain-containing protein [Verrucomicrobiales bacterium]
DGSYWLGQKHSRSPRFIYPYEDWPFKAMVWEIADKSGGLFRVDHGELQRINSAERGVRGDMIFDAAESESGVWLSTSAGLSLVNRETGKVASFGRDHGLPVNRSTSVASVNGETFFAMRHDDHDGGLVKFDPETSVFRTITTAEGLPTNALETVSVVGDQLQLKFGVEYVRYGNFGYRQFPPVTFNPETDRVNKIVKPEQFKQNVAQKRAARERGRAFPILGGFTLGKKEIAGESWLLGTRGALIVPETVDLNELGRPFPEVEVLASTDPRSLLLTEARNLRKGRTLTMEQGIAHENPFVVADALAKLKVPVPKEDLDALTAALKSDTAELRSTAAIQLLRSAGELPGAVDALRAVADDPHPAVRAMAALAITEHTDDFPAEALTEIMKNGSYGNPPFAAESQIGIGLGQDAIIRAIAKRDSIDGRVFNFLLKFPPRYDSWSRDKSIFTAFGDAVKKRPDLARLILTGAKNTHTGGSTNRDFMRDVFRYTGPEMKPFVLEALQSKDRIIRANGALAVGAIGDESLVQPLLDALKLESGLSKGAVVWALGELQSKEALPRLVDLYREARNAQKRMYAAGGMQFAQAVVVNQAETRQIANIDELGADWDEIKASREAENAPADPRHDEPLLSPRMVLEAVEKIGPEHAQEFFRGLVGEKNDHEGRLAAARGLGDAPEDERNESARVLRILAADAANPRVQAAASVSLFLISDETGPAAVKTALSGPGFAFVLDEIFTRVPPERYSKFKFAVEELTRIGDNSKTTDFVRERAVKILQACR